MSTGRRDPRRARARARRGARSSRCASSAARETKTTRSGVNAFPSSCATAAAISSARRHGVRREHAEEPCDLAFHLVRDADCGRFRDGRMAHGRRLELGRPDALARDVQRVVGAPVQEPVAVLVDRRPVAVRPDTREAPPVRLEVALRVAPDAARHPRPGRLQTSSPTSPRTGRPASSKTSMSSPSAGKPTEHRLRRLAASTPRGSRRRPRYRRSSSRSGLARAAQTCSFSQSYGPRFHGSPVVTTARSDERSAARLAVREQGAHEGRRNAEHRHAFVLDDPPDAVVRPVGRALHEDDRRAAAPSRRRRSMAP